MELGAWGEIAFPSHIPHLAASVQKNTSVFPAWKRQMPMKKQSAPCQGLVASKEQGAVPTGDFGEPRRAL